MISLRSKFYNVKPERRHDEGENIKISGIRYKSMLDDNNSSNYEINWEELLIDTDILLSYANLDKTTTKVQVKNTSDSKTEKSDNETNDLDYLGYLLFGGLTVLIIVFLIFKKRAVKKG